jgi:hypothetical protein
LNKILVKLQGKTLILHYQVKPGLVRSGVGWTAYIEVLPSSGLAGFDIKGLTPEMFCVNISDSVNIRGLFSGEVENEQQITVAHWAMNEEEYLRALDNAALKPTHRQIVDLLERLPGYVQELDGQFVDFEENVVPHGAGEYAIFSGYRLTIVTEDMGNKNAPYAFYSLDTRTMKGWQDIPPPLADHAAVRKAMVDKLQAIVAAGVPVAQAHDETDYPRFLG